MEKALLTVREAAERLGIGPRKTRELASHGRLQEVRLGTRTVRYTAESVERLARPEHDSDNGA